MSQSSWTNLLDEMKTTLSQISFREKSQREFLPDEGFNDWKEKAFLIRKEKGVIYLIGNGASASMASHFAADLAKNAKVHTQVFSDLSLITAISNDLGYENVFLEPLKERANPEDMLVAISSSGNSKNILLAVDYACSIGMKVFTLSGMSQGNPLRSSGGINIYVPGKTYGMVETCHSAILHHWMDSLTAS